MQAPTMLSAPLDDAARRGAGLGLLLAAGGLALGFVVGGVFGAGAGLLGVGAARNGQRARLLWRDPSEEARQEAAKSASMAVVGGAMAVYLAWQSAQRKENV